MPALQVSWQSLIQAQSLRRLYLIEVLHKLPNIFLSSKGVPQGSIFGPLLYLFKRVYLKVPSWAQCFIYTLFLIPYFTIC